MIECFFCSSPQSSQREELAQHMFDFWKNQPGIILRPLDPWVLGCSDRAFQRERRIYAEENAQGEIYILTDDDMEPETSILEKWISEGVKILAKHPDFAILSAWPANANIVPWTPEEYRPKENSMVLEHVSVGGLRFIRKGAIQGWPDQKGSSYDTEQCESIRKDGLRVGYFKNLKAVHHGEGKSSLIERELIEQS